MSIAWRVERENVYNLVDARKLLPKMPWIE